MNELFQFLQGCLEAARDPRLSFGVGIIVGVALTVAAIKVLRRRRKNERDREQP